MKCTYEDITFGISGDVEITVEFLPEPFHCNLFVVVYGRKGFSLYEEHTIKFQNVKTSDLEDLRDNILKAIDEDFCTSGNVYKFHVNTSIFARWLLWYCYLRPQ